MYPDAIRVLVADPHPLTLAGLKQTIRIQPGLDLVGAGQTGPEALGLYVQLKPDVLLLDMRLPDMTGVDVVRSIRLSVPDAKSVIFSTATSEEDIFQALQAGVRGYLSKDSSVATVIECIHEVAAGRRYLTSSVAATLANRFESETLSQREREILTLLADGRCNKRISRDIGIAEGTIKFHLNNIFAKLGVKSRTAAINVALKRGLVTI